MGAGLRDIPVSGKGFQPQIVQTEIEPTGEFDDATLRRLRLIRQAFEN